MTTDTPQAGPLSDCCGATVTVKEEWDGRWFWCDHCSKTCSAIFLSAGSGLDGSPHEGMQPKNKAGPLPAVHSGPRAGERVEKECLCCTPNWRACRCPLVKESMTGEMHSRIEELEDELAIVMKHFLNLQRTNSDLTERLDKAKEQIKALSGTIASQKQTHDALLRKLDAAHARIRRLREGLKYYKSWHRSTIATRCLTADDAAASPPNA